MKSLVASVQQPSNPFRQWQREGIQLVSAFRACSDEINPNLCPVSGRCFAY
jgi:hypothetical protein